MVLRWLAWLENAVLVVLFAAMLMLAFVQIGIRNCESLLPFALSACRGLAPMLIWGDPLARLLVLWVALWGSMVAARSNQHIRMDAAVRFLPPPVARGAGLAAGLASAGLCLAVAWYSLRFVIDEYTYAGSGAAGLPSWVGASIIPFALAVVGLRLALMAIWPVAEPELEPVPGSEPGSASAPGSASEPGSGSVAGSESAPGSVSESESRSVAGSESASGSASESESESVTGSESAPGSAPESESRSVAGSESASGSVSESESRSVSGSESAPGSAAESESGSVAGSVSERRPASEPVSGSDPGPGPESGSESAPGVASDPTPAPGPREAS